MVDIGALAGSAATAIIAAMASDAWSKARLEIARLFARNDAKRESEETARLDTFKGELVTVAERDVHNRLHGYLEARLGDDPALGDAFFALIRKIYLEVGIEPPTMFTANHANATNGVVVQAGRDASVVVSGPNVVNFTAMTGQEAARKLETMSLDDARQALANMDPTLGARRIAFVKPERAQELLSNVDEVFAADLLAAMTNSEQAAHLLAGVEQTQAAAILDVALPDWAVARLAEMDPDRALMLLASMGAKRMENLLAAMERQQTVRLLGAVSKVFADQQRARLGFDLAQREAQQIIDRANAEAEAIRIAAQQDLEAGPEGGPTRQAVGIAKIPRRRMPRHRRADSEGNTEPHRIPDGNGAGPASTPDELLTLPTELFLMSHGHDGRPRVHQGTLETAIFGATLCELIRGKLLTIEAGCPAVAKRTTSTDQSQALILRSISTGPQQSVALWSRDLRRELFVRLAQRLTDTGVVVPVHKRRLLGTSTVVYYKPSDEVTANEAGVRLVRFLLDPSLEADERTCLLGTLVRTLGIETALPVGLRGSEIRELLDNLLHSQPLSDDVRTVLDGIRVAIVSVVTLPRVR